MINVIILYNNLVPFCVLIFHHLLHQPLSALGPNCGLSAEWLRPLTPDGICTNNKHPITIKQWQFITCNRVFSFASDEFFFFTCLTTAWYRSASSAFTQLPNVKLLTNCRLQFCKFYIRRVTITMTMILRITDTDHITHLQQKMAEHEMFKVQKFINK